MRDRLLAAVFPRGSAALKRADRWGGIPLVWLLGWARRGHRTPPRTLGSLGLMKTNAIGDTVLLAGVIADLRAALPDTRLVLVVGPNNLEVARLLDGPDRVLPLPLGRPHRAVALLRRQRLDALLDFGSWPRINAALAALSGARFIAGFRTADQHRHFAYDAVVDHSVEVHEIENYRRLAGVLGIEAGACPRLSARATADRDEPRYVVFHPWPGGTRRELKQWPADRWVGLAGHVAQAGLKVIVTGGAWDREESNALIAACDRAGVEGVESVAGELSLSALLDRLAGAAAVVSVDTGVMHIAAALDAPLVALQGPTSPERWGPLSPRAVSVTAAIPGCGYLNLGFDHPDDPPPCMEAIGLQEVRRALDDLLD